jgi:hypothetical protein
MQAASRPHSSGLSSQSRRVAIFAILLFGLSGLISGFAMGAFVRPKIPGITTSIGSGTTPAVSQSTSTKTTTQMRPINIGYPVVDQMAGVETANGTTLYTLSAHAVDTSIDAGHGKPLHAAGITGKLWIERIPGDGNVNLPLAKITTMNLQQPLTHEEIPNGLSFTTPQIQQTNSNGQVIWRYTVATNVHSGMYYLVELFDWQGKHYNWAWQVIRVKGAGD